MDCNIRSNPTSMLSRRDPTTLLNELAPLKLSNTAAISALQLYPKSLLIDLTIRPCLELQSRVLSKLTEYFQSALSPTSSSSSNPLQMPSEHTSSSIPISTAPQRKRSSSRITPNVPPSTQPSELPLLTESDTSPKNGANFKGKRRRS